ncbi:MAG TPA: MFS transporter [Polyangiaceae bacterium]|nr:MFS transporter [Polyangiaceae bacterium]
MMSDRTILYTTAFIRALGVGMVAVLLAVYLAQLDFAPDAVGYVIAAGLTGNALALLVVTVWSDRFGRKRMLLQLTLLWATGAAVTALATSASVLAPAAFLGMLNGMGRDRGAALALEQAILPATTSDAHRTRAFAWYNAVQDVGHALGALLAGVPVVLERTRGLSPMSAHRLSLWGYVGLAALTAALYVQLSPACEIGARRAPLTAPTRRVLAKISALFALDSLGGGFLTTALLSYFFFERFGASEIVIAALFFGARLANALSHFGAAVLARKIGLVNTMVFTHIPSSLLLVTVAFTPSFPVAAALFLLREGLVEMDVPTRQSYIMAMVRPEERTVASGVTNLVRMGAWAIGPLFAGILMRRSSLMMPLVIGAAMKITYDVLLYTAFRKRRPPEETAGMSDHADRRA